MDKEILEKLYIFIVVPIKKHLGINGEDRIISGLTSQLNLHLTLILRLYLCNYLGILISVLVSKIDS